MPRPIIRLERHPDGVRVTQPETGRDLTNDFDAWCAERVAALGLADLDGFVLKARSPSCGLADVKSFAPDGSDERTDGIGRFATALREADAELPLIDEEQIEDEGKRAAFLTAAAERSGRRRG